MLNYLKQNTLALLGTMALAFGATQTADAQVIWGAGSTNTRIDSIGTFAATDSTFAPLGWTAIAYSTPAPTLANTWIWKQNAFPRGQYSSSAETLSSPSAANGAAIFESNYFYDVNQTIASSGALVSPIIDLTGQTNGKLNIKFFTRTRNFTLDSMHVGFSTNGGTTWTDKDLVPIINIPNPNDEFEGVALVGISNLLAGVTDLDSCRIRFRYKSDVYYWTIDDVSIVPADPFDVEIVTQSTGNRVSDGFTVYVPGNNATQPLSQVTTPAMVRADRPNEWGFFGARLRNKGATTLVGSARNAKLFLKIEKSAGAGAWTFKMLDSIGIDTLKPDSFKVALDTFDNGWRPDSVGTYRYTYYVSMDTAQYTTSNDTFVGTFVITPNIYSKAPLLADGFPALSDWTSPASGTGNSVTEFEWASMYYFPRGANMRLDSVRYRLATGASMTTASTSANAAIKIYKYKDTNGSGGIDDTPSASELALVALGNNNAIPFGAAGSKKITAYPVDIQSGSDPLMLNDTTIYLVSIAQTNANGLFNSGAQRGFYVGYNEINNYTLASQACSNDIFYSNSAIKVVETGASPRNEWNPVGFGQDLVPSIALYISPVAVAVQEVNNVVSANVNVYPNPAKTVLNVKVEMDAASDLRYIMTDASGRVVRMNTSKNIQTETVSFDVEQLSAGVYFISVLTNKGVSTHRFVKE